jgi:hypothetical protein
VVVKVVGVVGDGDGGGGGDSGIHFGLVILTKCL